MKAEENEVFDNTVFETGKPLGRIVGLKDCPLCGGKEGDTVFIGYKYPRYIVSCGDCNLRLFDDRADKVQGNWNTRNGFNSITGEPQKHIEKPNQ